MSKRWTAVVAIGLALAGCGGDSAPTATSSPSPAASRPRSTATIRIIEPQDGATVKGPNVLVRVELTGGRVIERASTTLTPDTGHVHILLDGETVTLLAGVTYQMRDVAPGRHLITAEFAANDHGSFSPRVVDVTAVTVT